MILAGIGLTISAPVICWRAGDATLVVPLVLACYGLVFGGVALCEMKSEDPDQ